MKVLAAVFSVAFFVISAFAAIPKVNHLPAPKLFINVIEGTVYDRDHRPVPDLWVELLNELGMGNRRVRTGTSGHYSFEGLADGRYEVKVYTAGTPFEEQSQSIDVFNLQGGTSNFYADFVLKFRPGMAGAVGIPQANEVIFAQQIPDEAKRLYKLGLKDLETDPPKGQSELDQAIKVFPDYYDALNTLGCSYVNLKEYQKSLPYLIHAIDVNQRSFSSFYSLAYAAYKLNHLPEASEAARASAILQPNSLNAQLLYGTVLRLTGNYDKALETLLKAEKLSKDVPLGEVHWQLALVYIRVNKNKEAADQFETYLKLEPDNPNKKEVQDMIQKMRKNNATT